MASFRAELKSEFIGMDAEIPTEDVIHNIAVVTGLVDRTRGLVSRSLHLHIDKVADIAERYGNAAGFPVMLRNALVLLAKGHDVGKSEYPHLLDVYPFDTAQREEYRGHVAASVRLLAGLKGTHGEIITQSIADHHERPHGRGYPNRKSGAELSRLTVAFIILDVFATIVWPPPSSPRSQWDPLQRLKHFVGEIRKGQGDNEFDKGAGDLFLRLLERGIFDDMTIEFQGRTCTIGELSKTEIFK